MSKSRLSAGITLVVLIVVVVGIGLRPELLNQLPLTSTDRRLISFFNQVVAAPRQIVSPTPAVEQHAGMYSATVSASLDLVILRPAATESAIVERAVDGDTIKLTDGRTVRYIGIDTPETKHPTKAVQCFGKEAAAYNAQLVTGKTVVLENDVSATDRYGRLLKYVWLDGQLVNYQLVAAGYAVASSFPPDIARQSVFQEAARQAREHQLGLWAACPE